ncbi:MAG TPA: Gfo/Idh/MocA family oxidoreductase, partial [Agriterribacter sp.]|nr:Gfo/Idh/MocA family oxidoreductase [Agriterribacter sp.]
MFGLLHTEKDGKIIRERYPSHKGSYADYYNELYESIVNGRPVKEKPGHGYNIIRIIELAMQSNKEKRPV